MTPERWRQIEEVFARADELPDAQLEAFLATACAGDPSLRAEVVELLGYRGAGSSLHRIVDAELRQSPSSTTGEEHSALRLPDRLVDRFQIRGQLGAGGMGVVFEAYDEQRGELVALKALPHNDPHRIGALKQEFRAIANVSHPRLVRLHELFADGKHWFFTMQKIEGAQFLDHVRPGGALDEAALRVVLRDLVDGIRAVHGAGRLHRDLKPSNVLVAGGHAVILDFGLARALHEATEIAGTPDYMAPEAFAGRASRESDWYALGVMLFEALTGVRPRGPRDPRELVQSTPDDLAKLAHGLLSADPPARSTALAAAGFGESDTGEQRPTAFIGRATELAALAAAFREVRATARPVLVRVAGTSGIGKSTLVARYLDELDGALVLRGRCYERENVPFKALDAIVDALAHQLAEAPPPAPEYAGDLCRIFPSLGRVFPGAAITSDPRLARQRATTALVALVAPIAAARPLVISIDDLQWGDADSGVLITALLAAGVPALWIVSYRSGERCDLADALDAHPGPRLAIDGLDATDSAALVLAMAGEANAAVIRTIVEEAGGNPFFIGELTRGPRVAHAAHVDLAALVQERVGSLDARARRLLEVIALAGSPISIGAASRAARLLDDAAIPELRAGSWVRTNHTAGRGIVEPYHDRIRSAVVGGLDATTRRELHGDLARVLEVERAAPELLALHFREAGDRDRAGHHTIAAAEAAARALAFDRAAALYRDAMELTGSQLALEQALGEVLANAGRGPDAAEAYLRAAQLADAEASLELERRAAHQYFSTGNIAQGRQIGQDVLHRLGLWIPKHPRAAQLVGLARFGALILRGHKAPKHTVDTPLALQQYDVTNELFQNLASFEPMHGLYFAASAASRGVRLADPLRRADAIGSVAAIMSLVRGRSGGAAEKWLRAQREVAEAVGTPAALGVAATYDGVCATYIGDWERAALYLTEAEKLLSACEGVVYRFQLATVQAIDSWVQFYSGRIQEFLRRQARRLEEATGKGNVMAMNAQTTHVCVTAPLVADDVPAATRALELAEARMPDGYTQQHTWVLLARCMHALYIGDPAAGHARLHSELAAFKRTRMMDVHIARLQFMWIRGACAAAAALVSSEREAERLRRECKAQAVALRKVPVGGGEALGNLVHAAVAPRSEVNDLLERARTGLFASGMVGYAHAAGWHLGGAPRDDAEAYFDAEGVARPERFISMLAPGFDVAS